MNRYFAVDIGGSSVKHAIVDEKGAISGAGSFKTGSDITRELFISRLLSATEKALSEGVSGVGVSSLGWIDPKTGTVCGGVENLPAIDGLCIPDVLKNRFGIETDMHNDVDSMALGEGLFGAGRGFKSYLCVAPGTGIGGAIVINGQLWTGANHHAGEIGYIDWKDDGSCLERQTSATNMIREAAHVKNMPDLDGREFFRLISAGDAECAKVLSKHMSLLAACLANLMIALDFEAAIIGGGISKQGDALMTVLRAEFETRLPDGMKGKYPLIAAQCGNDAALLGAVSRWMKPELKR